MGRRIAGWVFARTREAAHPARPRQRHLEQLHPGEWENDIDVTMVQRLSTPIAPSAALMALALGGRYSEQALKAGIDHHMGDLIFANLPQVPLRWVHGGNLHQSRHCSQLLSLQLKVRLAGIPTPVDGQAAVHHTR